MPAEYKNTVMQLLLKKSLVETWGEKLQAGFKSYLSYQTVSTAASAAAYTINKNLVET